MSFSVGTDFSLWTAKGAQIELLTEAMGEEATGQTSSFHKEDEKYLFCLNCTLTLPKGGVKLNFKERERESRDAC